MTLPDDVDNTFQALSDGGAQGIFVLLGAGTGPGTAQLAQRALAGRLPMMTWSRSSMQAGALMAYSQDQFEMVRRSAYYVDRILKGAKPADLPVQRPDTFQFILNLKVAQALGLAIPLSILAQATEVIH